MKRLPKAQPAKVYQINGYEFKYGIKLNIKQFHLDCVHVQPSFEVSSDELRIGYINTINKMKIKDAIKFIEEELKLGYLSNLGLHL
jgi:hypothetical protein